MSFQAWEPGRTQMRVGDRNPNESKRYSDEFHGSWPTQEQQGRARGRSRDHQAQPERRSMIAEGFGQEQPRYSAMHAQEAQDRNLSNNPSVELMMPDGKVRKVMHSAYNSPIGLYSSDNVHAALMSSLNVADRTKANLSIGREPERQSGPVGLTNRGDLDGSSLIGPGRRTISGQAHSGSELVCAACTRPIRGVFVRVAGSVPLHAACLKCTTCGIDLRGSGYFYLNGKLYCEPHAKVYSGASERQRTDNLFSRMSDH